MRTATRIALALLVLVATSSVLSFVAEMASFPLRPSGDPSPALSWGIYLASLICGIYAARFTFRRIGHPQHGVAPNWQESVLVGALLGGALCFVLGFFGPMMFSDSNLGPIAGFFTGPMGAVLGAVAGGLYNSLVARKGRA
jgi:hypothetical protein